MKYGILNWFCSSNIPERLCSRIVLNLINEQESGLDSLFSKTYISYEYYKYVIRLSQTK